MRVDNQISNLIEFIQRAIKLGKYNSNTGGGMLNAVRVAEKGLSDEEPKDIDYLVEHLEELFIRQKDLNLSPQSQAVYFGRVKKAAEDFRKYGLDAKAIYSWSPKPRKVTTKRGSNGKKNEDESVEEEQPSSSASQPQGNITEERVREVGGVRLNVVTWRLRPGVLVKIELPEDLTKADVEKIKRLLDLEIEIFE